MKSFSILPAIDLQDGKCVRLRQGVAEDETVYGDDPVDMARKWEDLGATYLHVVDLSGAFAGKPVHTEVIGRIVEALSIPVEVGGGLRAWEDVKALVDVGVDRAILGTKALTDPDLLVRLLADFGGHVALGIDARDGRVQISGWMDTTDTDAYVFAGDVMELGVETIIYTDTSRDGMLQGVNAEAMGRMCEAAPDCTIIASGGVTDLADVRVLRELGFVNLGGVIVGKALYDERVTMDGLLAEAGR